MSRSIRPTPSSAATPHPAGAPRSLSLPVALRAARLAAQELVATPRPAPGLADVVGHRAPLGDAGDRPIGPGRPDARDADDRRKGERRGGERRTHERRDRERRALDHRVAAVVERMSDAFIALDARWRVTYANHEAAHLNGTTPDALVGQDHWELWPETVGTAVEREYRRVLAEGGSVQLEHHYAGADVWHDIRAYPAEDGGLAVFYRDITARKRRDAERERLLAMERDARAEAERQRIAAERAREVAEAANEEKARYLAVVSHELRTPLTAIGGYAQLMELGIYGELTEEQNAALGRIRAGQEHVLGLLNAVLRHAKLGAGRVQFEVEAVPVADTLAAVASLVEPQARAKGLALHVLPPAAAPPLVARADAEKVRQVLVNLLSNAVKFTPAGGTIAIEADAADASAVTIRVRDTGPGIPEGQRDRVFEPFVQLDRQLSSGHEGVGLGLAISRELARGMGGELSVESAIGAGCTFVLRLPRLDMA